MRAACFKNLVRIWSRGRGRRRRRAIWRLRRRAGQSWSRRRRRRTGRGRRRGRARVGESGREGAPVAALQQVKRGKRSNSQPAVARHLFDGGQIKMRFKLLFCNVRLRLLRLLEPEQLDQLWDRKEKCSPGPLCQSWAHCSRGSCTRNCSATKSRLQLSCPDPDSPPSKHLNFKSLDKANQKKIVLRSINHSKNFVREKMKKHTVLYIRKKILKLWTLLKRVKRKLFSSPMSSSSGQQPNL